MSAEMIWGGHEEDLASAGHCQCRGCYSCDVCGSTDYGAPTCPDCAWWLQGVISLALTYTAYSPDVSWQIAAMLREAY